MAKTRTQNVTVEVSDKGRAGYEEIADEREASKWMERGREARTSGQVDVVFGIGQWLGCLRQQGINDGGGLDESASHHDPTKA
jgi:hypothetical protein